MSLGSAARSYLRAEDSLWPKIASNICSTTVNWLGGALRVSQSQLEATEFPDELWAELTSPALLTIVASAPNLDAATQAVVDSVKALVEDNPTFEVREDQPDRRDDIVDVVSGRDDEAWVVRRGELYDEGQEDDATRIMGEFRRVQLGSRTGDLGGAVRKALALQTQIVVPDFALAVRLDAVDAALYHAVIGHPGLLRTLDWRLFEKLLADILDRFGFEVELQRGTKDGGGDLFAVKKRHPLGPQRFLLQAKRWKNAVGVEPVRQLAFLHSHHRVTKSCLATTATFTRGAWELAHQYRWQLELRDFEGLMEWVREAAIIKGKT